MYEWLFRPRSDSALWHEFNPLFPVRLMDGTMSKANGQIWRRRKAGEWEYRQDDESLEDFKSRQW